MDGFVDMIPLITFGITFIAIVGFVIVSTVMFIRDGIKAKREGRKRNGNINALFIISIIIVIFAVMFLIFLSIMASRIMLGM